MSDTQQLYLKPAAAGVLVRDPVNGAHLPAEGAWKPRNGYWLRRLRDKDVVKATPPKATSAKKTDKE